MSSGIAEICVRWRGSLVAKIFTVCFAAIHLPLIATIVFLVAGRPDAYDLAFTVFGATLLATVVCLWTIHLLLRPIRRMSESIAEYRKTGKADPRPSGRRDELGRLERGMAQMLSSLDSILSGLRQQAYSDPLTGAGNRRWLDEVGAAVIDRARRSNERLMVLTFDLDHFKAINDRHGHAIGDRVLHDVAVQVRRLIRQYDLFVRTGGEEFCVITQGTSGMAPTAVAEHLRQGIEQMEAGPLAAGCVTASFGVHFGDPFLEDLPAMIEKADQQLYRSKERGRNRISLSVNEAPALDPKILPIPAGMPSADGVQINP